MNNRHLYILALTLVIIGAAFFIYKSFILQFPLYPAETSQAWDVEVSIKFKAEGKAAKVSLYLPRQSEKFVLVDEQFISQGFGMSIRKKNDNRLAVWSAREVSGDKALYYRTTLRVRAQPEVLVSTGRKPEPRKSVLFGAEELAANALLEEAKAKSADAETLTLQLLNRFFKSLTMDDNMKALMGGRRDKLRKLEVVALLLAKADVPARVTHGIRLQPRVRVQKQVHWLEVFITDKWVAYEPETVQPTISDDYLAWWSGPAPLVSLKNGKLIAAHISVKLNEEPAMLGATERQKYLRPFLHEFSIPGLPVETQNVYQVLLTVPVGVFVLVVMRNLVGVKTFGTFMPVLIALSFRETQLLWGIVLFCLVVGLGLTVRFYLENLKLLLVPRLAAVLIMVIILMAVISIVSHKLGMYRGLSVALFPMVILTMTIERMSIIWEERGAPEAFQQGIGSLLVATLAYLLMNIELVKHLVFVFPELLLVLLAMILLLGRYSGYRLLELRRFRALTRGGG